MTLDISVREPTAISVPSVRQPYRRWMVPVAILAAWAAAQIAVLAMMDHIAFPLDDGYIVLHNAQSLIAGDENFAGGPPLSGATSLLHTLATTLLLLVLPGPLTLWFLQWLAILVAGLGFDRLAHNSGCGPGMRLAIVAGVLLAGQPLLVLLNGVETGWAIAASAWALALAVSPGTDRRLPILCGLMPFIRPELGALAALLLLDRAWRRYAECSDLKGWTRGVGQDLLTLAAASLPLLAVQWLGGGGPLPNTAAAKHYFFADFRLPLGARIALVTVSVAFFAKTLGPIFLSMFLIRTRFAMLGTVFTLIILASFLLMLPSGGFYNGHRYLYILTPIMAVNLIGALGAGKRGWRTAAMAILGMGIIWNLATLPGDYLHYAAKADSKLRTMSGLAQWIETNLNPVELVLIHDIGYVAYATAQPLNDLVGLKTPDNIDIHRRHTVRAATIPSHQTLPAGDAGWGESIERIALRSGARILVVSDGWEPEFRMASGLQARGWSLIRLSTDRLEGYEVYRIDQPRTPLPRDG